MEKNIEILVNELKELDREMVDVDGTRLKPSQCYHFETDPAHMLFNLNCPEALKEKIQGLITKYLPGYEGRTSQ
ncbi:MAG: hypothetical protein ABIT05_15365 [Chitinophagaceae bacterium]